ncbi:hypothetical protein [Mammaliicoccus sciuri]|uniref:Uncharacterized protein n=1 Tax=Mammaliicoccus sciuri TaxID=1296 RepID=A0AAI8GV48_MAMSC|nr:hypothetical protein [Mammaliicoccus sciuri]ASE35736.1 hypothetical protein CEP64_14065 [Mammaliicoccus sciuri]
MNKVVCNIGSNNTEYVLYNGNEKIIDKKLEKRKNYKLDSNQIINEAVNIAYSNGIYSFEIDEIDLVITK